MGTVAVTLLSPFLAGFEVFLYAGQPPTVNLLLDIPFYCLDNKSIPHTALLKSYTEKLY